MRLFNELKRVTSELQGFPGCWALCGGVVASVYRKTPRFTHDLDIALIEFEGLAPEIVASRILEKLGYSIVKGFVPGVSGANTNNLAMLCGRIEMSEMFAGVDFLLPAFSWVKDAVLRAQSNLVDYGFSKLPTITLEDLLLAKVEAAQSNARNQDIDDIKSLLSEGMHLDRGYFRSQSSKLGIAIPTWVDELIA